MTDLNTLPLPALYKELASTGLITRLLELARDEDLGDRPEHGDVTSRAFVPNYPRGDGKIVARRPGVVAGLAAIPEVLHIFRADVDLHPIVSDGDPVAAGEAIATLSGNLRAMLGAERTILNILGRLSGVATRTAAFVAAVKNTRARIFDTRKTTPGLRLLEKYAVRCGGGFCHRLGLHDAVLIKDNHLAAIRIPAAAGAAGFADHVRSAVARAHDEAGRAGLRFIMLEVDRLDQLQALLDAKGGGGAGVNIVLLDNMTPDQLRQCVAARDKSGVPLELEASGGVSLETVAAIAASGVDRISTGSLTHGATWLDIALDL